MSKKYQVFVSSTYQDLADERWAALRALLSLDCIVSGMELFPAVDMDQFEYIKKIIDDCDYYILIIGGKYGTISSSGTSYTEMEYDYARQKNIPVIALLHKNPDSLPPEKRETSPGRLALFNAFREKASSSRLVRFWETIKDIELDLMQGYLHTTRLKPGVGWVRADKVANEEALNDLNKMRKENEKVTRELEEYRRRFDPKVEGLAPLDELMSIAHNGKEVKVTWEELFFIMYDALREGLSKREISLILCEELFNFHRDPYFFDSLEETMSNIFINQFLALNFIEPISVVTAEDGHRVEYKLTELGRKYGLAEKSFKARPSKANE